MTLVLRLIVLGALCWLAYILFGEVRHASALQETDSTRVILLFGGIVLVAVAIAVFFAIYILPRIGEKLVGSVYNPNEQIERDPHSAALAKKAGGDWEGAVRAYLRCYAKNPDDSVALNDIIHIYTDKIGNPTRAATLLERELSKEWPPEHAAFLASRLVDVYLNHQHDIFRARALLIQIAETMPDTAHAANAQHRLRDIDRMLAEQESNVALGGGDTEAEPAAPEEPGTRI